SLLGGSRAFSGSATCNVPVFVVDVPRGKFADTDRIPVWLTVHLPTTNQLPVLEPLQFSGEAALWIHGNSSRAYRKKSYRIELRDETGADRKASLCGLPAESDWILYAS